MKYDATDEQDGVLIVGYGNTLRADDGVGVVIAEMLQSQAQQQHVRIITEQQLGFEMADQMATAASVAFIDASTDLPPGEMSFKRIEADEWMRGAMGHHLRPGTLLGMTQALYGRSPEVYVLSVGVESLHYGQELSGAVEHVVLRAAAILMSWIREREVSHA